MTTPRSLLVAVLAVAAFSTPAAAGELATTCTGVSEYGSVCRVPEAAASNGSAACRRDAPVADEQCATPLNRPVSERAITDHEGSWVHRALAMQYELGSSLGFRDAMWVGTHNSTNSASEPFTPSQGDHNQQLSLTDQLRIDVRSLELDLHWFQSPRTQGARAVVACHARGADQMHAGCSNERLFVDRMPEIAQWLEANPDEVILLYLEDHLEGLPGHDSAAAILESAIGPRIYRASTTGSCRELPGTGLTRDAVRAAGKQVVLVASGCGQGSAWRNLVFDWRAIEDEARPVDYSPSCTTDFSRSHQAAQLIRYYEDSTVLAATTWPTGVSSMDDGLTPATTAAMARCGVELFGFDQLLPDDGRLPALVWSYAEGEPSAGDACAVRKSNGRWEGRSCDGRLRYACRTEGGGWVIAGASGAAKHGADRCARKDGVFEAPRSGPENEALSEIAGRESVWVGIRPAPKPAAKSKAKRRG